jgi:hypothetical protein
MSSPKLQGMKIVYYTSLAANDTTNAIFLLGAFLVLQLRVCPADAWAYILKSPVLKFYSDLI